MDNMHIGTQSVNAEILLLLVLKIDYSHMFFIQNNLHGLMAFMYLGALLARCEICTNEYISLQFPKRNEHQRQ